MIRRYSDARAGRTGTDGALPAPVAQRIEQQPSNLSVVGSIPTGGAKYGSGIADSPTSRVRVANAPPAERWLEGRAQPPARHRHVKRPRPLATQKYASLTHRQEQSGRADPTIASRQSCHSDPSVASSCAPSPCTRIGSSHQARSDAPERTTRAANRDAHALEAEGDVAAVTSALRQKTAVGGPTA